MTWKCTKNPTGGYILTDGDLIVAWIPGKTQEQDVNAGILAAASDYHEAAASFPDLHDAQAKANRRGT